MKRAVFALLAMGVLAILSGCTTDPACGPRRCVRSEYGCGRPDCPRCGRGGGGQEAGDPGEAGPATGAITYPYYTLHGPRDFLQRTPSPIGP
jgi:hypothetical protein